MTYKITSWRVAHLTWNILCILELEERSRCNDMLGTGRCVVFLFSRNSRLVLRSTFITFSKYRLSFERVKRPGHKFDHFRLVPSLRMSGAIYLRPICLIGEDRDNFAFKPKPVGICIIWPTNMQVSTSTPYAKMLSFQQIIHIHAPGLEIFYIQITTDCVLDTCCWVWRWASWSKLNWLNLLVKVYCKIKCLRVVIF
jgi:hypothetical protein